jgi:hypothetical protein
VYLKAQRATEQIVLVQEWGAGTRNRLLEYPVEKMATWAGLRQWSWRDMEKVGVSFGDRTDGFAGRKRRSQVSGRHCCVLLPWARLRRGKLEASLKSNSASLRVFQSSICNNPVTTTYSPFYSLLIPNHF